MSALAIEYRSGGVFLPQLGLWLDPHEPRAGPVFVSHAHSDHVADHQEVILSAPTAGLISVRLGGARRQHVLAYGQESRYALPGGIPFRLILLPAGHIFGSAMAWIEAAGETLLYTGDFKLRPGLSAEPCQPRPADLLVMETTFGRPHYRFPPSTVVMESILRFCRQALDNDEVPVLLGYSLGKSQELLCGLADAGLPIMLHGSVFNLTQTYAALGQSFPDYMRYEPGTVKGHVLLCPPNVANSAMLRNLGRARVAVLTGWAVDPDCRYRYGADAAFPLSDHADFPELLRMVKEVSPRQVYTLHGFAADFAQSLRELGFKAQAISEDEQMVFSLPIASPASNAPSAALGTTPAPSSDHRGSPPPEEAGFHLFSQTCASIAATSSKLQKVRLLAGYFQRLDHQALPIAAIWMTGSVFSPGQNKVLNLGWAMLRDALCRITALQADSFHQVYLKHSDLGETAFELLRDKADQPARLSIIEAQTAFEQLLVARGPSRKLPLLCPLLSRCTPLEAKFLVKIITGDLRIGLKAGLVEEAIALAFNVSPTQVRQADLLLGDIGQTAILAARGELGRATLEPFRAVKLMLASPEQTANDIVERAQAWPQPVAVQSSSPPADAQPSPPLLWLEDKYDGIRCQLHKVQDRVALYSRDLKDITATFDDLAASARCLAADVILDGEVVAMRGEQILAFAELQKRLGRREQDLFLRDQIPIRFVAFDCLWHNGQSLLQLPLRDRRAVLESLQPLPPLLTLARITTARTADEIEAAFTAARTRNNEGLLTKDPQSSYTPGRRGLSWLKLKKAFATLDCVVVGAEYGHGRRNKVLSDYTFAVRDEETGELKVIGKAYSGLTDDEISGLTANFLAHTIRQHGRYLEVRPEIVLEIAFDRIQASQRHESGLALRFPRILRIRHDKPLSEIDTLQTARQLVQREGTTNPSV